MTWSTHINIFSSLLQKISIQTRDGQKIDVDAGFQRWHSISRRVREENNQLFLIGNGASSSMASHFATDIVKNGGIKAHVFTDMSLLTALSNDLSFQEVYAKPLQWYAKAGDMLIAISSSGNSPNIIQAVNKASEIGMSSITLSAMNPKNTLRHLGDLNFYIQAQSYGLAESGHATIMHYWMDLLEHERASR